MRCEGGHPTETRLPEGAKCKESLGYCSLIHETTLEEIVRLLSEECQSGFLYHTAAGDAAV